MVSRKNVGVSEEAGAGFESVGAASDSCERFDVVIVGCGSSGLYTALNLPAEMSVLVLAKTEASRCDSMLAQGSVSCSMKTTTIPSTKTPCAPAIMRTALKAWISCFAQAAPL